jgi:hypothetical protein
MRVINFVILSSVLQLNCNTVNENSSINIFPQSKQELYSSGFHNAFEGDGEKGDYLFKKFNDTTVLFFYPLDDHEYNKVIYYPKKNFDSANFNRYFKTLDKNYSDTSSILTIIFENKPRQYQIIRKFGTIYLSYSTNKFRGQRIPPEVEITPNK